MRGRLERLTRQQVSVAYLIARAETSKGIAALLGMSEGNVERHVCNIARIWKLDPRLNLRVQIALIAPRYYTQEMGEQATAISGASFPT